MALTLSGIRTLKQPPKNTHAAWQPTMIDDSD